MKTKNKGNHPEDQNQATDSGLLTKELLLAPEKRILTVFYEPDVIYGMDPCLLCCISHLSHLIEGLLPIFHSPSLCFAYDKLLCGVKLSVGLLDHEELHPDLMDRN